MTIETTAILSSDMSTKRRGAPSFNSTCVERREWYDLMQKHIRDEVENDVTTTEEKGTAKENVNKTSGAKQKRRQVNSDSAISGANSTYSSLSTKLFDEVSAQQGLSKDKKAPYVPYARKRDFNGHNWIRKINDVNLACVKGRLICFPGLGGNCNHFLAWGRFLELRNVEVYSITLPGRLYRLYESSLTNCVELVGTIVDSLLVTNTVNTGNSLPFCLYGHSFGAILAFEVTRSLEKINCSPCHLIVSSSVAPHALHEKNVDPFQVRYSECHDNDLLDRVRQLGGVPDILWKRKELLMLMLKPIRADLLLLEHYISYLNEEIENCHVTDYECEAEKGSVPMLETTSILTLHVADDINHIEENTPDKEHFLQQWEIQTKAHFNCWPKFSAGKYNWIQQDMDAVERLCDIIYSMLTGCFVFPEMETSSLSSHRSGRSESKSLEKGTGDSLENPTDGSNQIHRESSVKEIVADDEEIVDGGETTSPLSSGKFSYLFDE